MAKAMEITAMPRRTIVDGATLLGLSAAFTLILLAMILGGAANFFFNLPAVLIVVGGTLAVTTICFSFSDIASTISVLKTTVMYRERDTRDIAYTMVELADYCRSNGALKLQGTPLLRFSSEPFLHKGLSLVIDGLGDHDVMEILNQDLSSSTQRQLRASSVLRKAAEIAPAMGLIGTLIGLVQMLGQLQNPDAIGPAMAVALLTTFYGAILSTIVFNPVASKLERNATEEHVVHNLYLLGVVSIARKDNPRRLEMQLNSALPPESRVKYFD
ncbi:MAG: motility protein A [Rhodospirillaceae bacterium]